VTRSVKDRLGVAVPSTVSAKGMEVTTFLARKSNPMLPAHHTPRPRP